MQMGDWRDSDRSQIIEETGVVVEIKRESYFEYPNRLSNEKFVRSLDIGPLIDDPSTLYSGLQNHHAANVPFRL